VLCFALRGAVIDFRGAIFRMSPHLKLETRRSLGHVVSDDAATRRRTTNRHVPRAVRLPRHLLAKMDGNCEVQLMCEVPLAQHSKNQQTRLTDMRPEALPQAWRY
jgi:hypothetical protein